MTDKEKYSLLSEVLKNQHTFIDKMTEEQLLEYVELMSIFLKTKDPIYEESAIGTMTLMVKNIRKSFESELEAEVNGIDTESKSRSKARKITRLPESHKSKMTIKNAKANNLLKPYTKISIETPSVIKKIERLLGKIDKGK